MASMPWPEVGIRGVQDPRLSAVVYPSRPPGLGWDLESTQGCILFGGGIPVAEEDFRQQQGCPVSAVRGL